MGRQVKWRTSKWVYAARYVSGRPMSGNRVTDCTFLRAGTRTADPLAHPSRWAYLPGYQRALWRLGTPATLAALAAAEVTHPVATESTLATLTAAGLTKGTLRTVRAVKQRHHTRTYVKPLAAVLGRQLGYPVQAADKWLSVPLDFKSPDYDHDPADPDPDDQDDQSAPAVQVTRTVLHRMRTRLLTRTGQHQHPDGTPRLSGEVRVMLPVALPDSPDWQRVLRQSVAGKLGIPVRDLDATYHMVGAEPYAIFRRAPRPPRKIGYAAMRPAIESAPPSAPVLGMGARHKVVGIDLDTDAPHIAVSCSSGAGKSVLMRTIIAQFLSHGAQIFIFDVKRISQSWCKDHPSVTYCRTGAQMHDAAMSIQAELDRRNEAIDAVPAEEEDNVDVGPRIVLIFEEQNAGINMMAEYWQKTRGKSDPKRSPAITALDYILCAGRQVKVHVISVAQMFTVQSAGGNPVARENYGVRILARASRQAWNMLAPEVGPQYPPSSRIRGRMHMVFAGTPTEFQTVILSKSEARALADSATVTVPTAWTAPRPRTEDNRDVTPTVTPAAPEPTRFTLAEASREEWCTLDYATLRQRKRRAGENWPRGLRRGNRETWTEEELRAALRLDQVPTDQPADV